MYRFRAEYERGELVLELNSERVSFAMESLRPVIARGWVMRVGRGRSVDLVWEGKR